MTLRGSIRVPSDKSISHRAVLFSALASGTSHLRDLLPSDDVLSSLAAAERLGACIERVDGEHGIDAVVTGFAGHPDAGPISIDCGNSGTTARLLMGLVAGLGTDVTLVGDASLSGRPMRRVIDPLSRMGAIVECAEGGTLPVRVLPAERLSPIDYDSPKASAQVKSAILLAGLQAKGVTRVTEPHKSRDHTELLLPAFGVGVQVEGQSVSLEGPARLSACDVRVPGDASSGAFVAVAAALIEGSEVCIERMSLNPTRIGAFEVLRRMGVPIEYGELCYEGAEPYADVTVGYADHLVATHIAAAEVPSLIDEIPVLALAAAAAAGETVFEQVGELRVKEADRLAAVLDGLAAFCIEAWADGDDLHICGIAKPLAVLADEEELEDGVSLPTFHDHRLAMTWHIMGLASEVPVALDDASCVSVSWPDFFDDLETLLA